jgi:branched-chain amino acid transport system ATP-binding protein
MTLEVANLAAGYTEQNVIEDVSFSVPAGDLLAILGANGAGKTTLLATLMGMIPARRGSVWLDGADVTRASAQQRVRRGIAYVPERREFFGQHSARRNLEAAIWWLKRSEIAERLEEALGFFPALRDRMEVRAGLLSGGQQQMLAFARAFIQHPRVMIIDEPTIGLAPLAVAAITDILARFAQSSGMAIVLTEQNMRVGLAAATRALVMAQGRVAWSGPAALLDAAEVERAYLSGDTMETGA